MYADVTAVDRVFGKSENSNNGRYGLTSLSPASDLMSISTHGSQEAIPVWVSAKGLCPAAV
jgi:hypothetical protein